MTEKRIELTLPVLLAIKLKSTAKDLAVMELSYFRIPQKDEPPGMFKEVDEKLKAGTAHIVKLNGVLSVPGLFIRVFGVAEEKPEETSEEEKKNDDGRGIPEVEAGTDCGTAIQGGDPEPGGEHPVGPETSGEPGANEPDCETGGPATGNPDRE